ncbi:MAG: hypothetical protein V1703_00310 [Candidatus Altiarchaeota archaeon]
MKLSRIVSLTLTTLLLFTLIGGVSAAKPYIRSVSFSKEPLIPDQSFDITVKVRNVETSMEVWIYLDEDTFPYKKVNVGVDSQEPEISVPKDDWGVKINLQCGTHTLRADLVKSGQVYDSYTLDFNVGNVPLITLVPARPISGNEVKILLQDRETEDPLKSLRAVISFQGEDQEPSTHNTDTAGYILYTPSKPGKYKLLIETKKQYCGEMFFYAKRNMLVDGPKPANPMVGDMITLAVPAGDIGVRIYDSNGDFYLAARTMITGAVNFTINDPGKYTLVIGEGSSRYWSINKTLNVSSRPSLSVEIEPQSPYVKSPVTITVKAGETPLSNAKVKVITPEGVQREYATLANGKVIYDGVATMGEYTVAVEKSGYESILKTFKAKSGFQVEFDPQMPFLNQEFTLMVKDQDGVAVPDAELSISEIEFVGATDSEGKQKITLRETNPGVEPGEYTLMVTKDMFWNLVQKIKTQDTLEITTSKDVEVGDDASISVYNSRGGLVGETSLSVKITIPDNTVTSLNKANFTFKPSLVGDYIVDVNKDNYQSTSGSIKVNPHPLSIDAVIDGKEVVIMVSSHNNSVEGMGIQVGMQDGKVIKSVTTDSKGLARVVIESEGNITITVNDGSKNPLYEEKSTSRSIKKSYRVLLLIVLIAAIVVGALLLAYIIWYFRVLPHRMDKERFESRKGRGGLSKF